VLDAQMRADKDRSGNCYGGLLWNCCGVPIRVTFSLNPRPQKDGKIVALVALNGGEDKEVLPVSTQVRDFTLKPDEKLTVFWQDADDKFNVAGAELDWNIQSVTAADTLQ
jgi:hypothetical protein